MVWGCVGFTHRRVSMADSLAAVVLAAGAGTRLRPLTSLRPKALCPVDNVPLVDSAIAHVRAATADVAVNAHHGRDALVAHLDGAGVHVSVEADEALGTAGALGRLRDWIAGRPVLVANADAWHRADLGAFAAGWDGERVRLLTVVEPARSTWGDRRYAGAALMPWSEVGELRPEPSGLYEVSWRRRQPGDGLDLVLHDGPFFDCGTPAGYLGANLTASGGRAVVARDAVVDGEVIESVVWPGAVVHDGERLHRAIRGSERVTVLVR